VVAESTSGSGRGPLPGGRSLSPRLVVAAVLTVLALVFVLQNTRRGNINFLFWEANAPVWLWFLGVFVVGVAVGSVFPWFRRNRGA
jgi:uncharacterized integral membrane protein